MEVVKRSWEGDVRGCRMFQVTQKLKRLKEALKVMNQKGFSNIQAQAIQAYQRMILAQDRVHGHGRDANLITDEKQATEQYKQAQGRYLSFLKQKTKEVWIDKGDDNTKMFHQSIKARRSRNRVYAIQDKQGIWQNEEKGVKEAFVHYYQELLGESLDHRCAVKSQIIAEGQVLTTDQQRLLNCNFFRQDVKRVMHSIPNDKSPGMDGFNSYFFKHCWDIVGDEVADAVLDFFSTGKLLKVINVTSLTLIPKVKSPTHVSDFRPISCCYVIYKCITKLLCENIKLVLPGLISQNQGAFVAQRSILHNVLLCQDIVKMYKPRQKQKCCLMKIDIQKAYDTVNWAFLEEILLKLGFPSRFVKLIMVCVESPTFSLMINGSATGFFNSKRGIRQGDPISPLLFVLCMEYFSRIMTFIGKLPGFQFHPRCKSMALNHLTFADDVILFCKGDFQSVQLMLQGILLFAAISGLRANPHKSDFYSCGLSEQENRRIMKSSGFKHGRLPFRYLGVPISTTKLNAVECEKLIEKMVMKIRIWSSRHISFAGRSQLVNVVLLSIYQCLLVSNISPS